MIDGIGRSATGRVSFDRGAIERSTAAAKPGEGRARTGASLSISLAAELAAAAGPPVDVSKIAAIRIALAEGRYAVNPKRIAELIITRNLPERIDGQTLARNLPGRVD